MRLVFDPETNEFTTYNRNFMEERFSRTSSTIAGSEHLSGTALAKIRSAEPPQNSKMNFEKGKKIKTMLKKLMQNGFSLLNKVSIPNKVC